MGAYKFVSDRKQKYGIVYFSPLCKGVTEGACVRGRMRRPTSGTVPRKELTLQGALNTITAETGQDGAIR